MLNQAGKTVSLINSVVLSHTCACREKLSTNHILFNFHQLNFFLRISDPFPNSTINTFPTDVLYYTPQYFVQLAHLLLKSPTGPHVWIVYDYEYIFVMYVVSAYIPFRVYVYIVIVAGLLIILSLSNILNILRSV